MSKVTAAALTVLVLLLCPVMTMAQPEVCGFYGYATVDGQSVPNGAPIKAWIDGSMVEQTTTPCKLDNCPYDYIIKIEDAGSYAGKTITFTVGSEDMKAGSAVWTAGGYTQKNLDATEGATSPSTPPVATDPAITLSPGEGIATQVSGEGFTPNATVTVMIGNTNAAAVDTGADGTFSIVVAASNQTAGTYTVTAIDGQGESDQAILTVPDLQGAPGAPGTPGAAGEMGPKGESGGTTFALVAMILSIIAIVVAILVAIRISTYWRRR